MLKRNETKSFDYTFDSGSIGSCHIEGASKRQLNFLVDSFGGVFPTSKPKLANSDGNVRGLDRKY